MKVIRANVLGFCMGVRRAVDMAWQESGRNNSRVYTYGPLIHNPGVLKALKERGVAIFELAEAECAASEMRGSPSVEISGALKNSTVIIRAHGVSPAVESDLAQQGVTILDATCPHVKASQNKARELSREGFFIFLAGEKEHSEIIGIRGYTEGSCFVVANPAEAETTAAELARNNPGVKTALIAQTTIGEEEYFSIGEGIKRYFPELAIINTICGATRERQNSLRELIPRADGFIIAGGRESANTRRLFSIAAGCGKKAWIVEDASGIPPEVSSCQVIGLAAGASTPDSVIDEIEAAIRNI